MGGERRRGAGRARRRLAGLGWAEPSSARRRLTGHRAQDAAAYAPAATSDRRRRQPQEGGQDVSPTRG